MSEIIYEFSNLPKPILCFKAHVRRLHPEMLKSDRPKEAESFVVGHINEDGTIRPITKEDRGVTENLSPSKN